MARPSEFSDKVADKICERLADGESLRTICCDPKLPAQSTVFRWLGNEDERFNAFREQYARAREAQADALFDEILVIADTQERGQKRTTKPDGTVETVEADMIEHRKVRIDARKWMAGKLRPKKYGDKTLIGSDPDNPLPTPGMTDIEAARLVTFMLTKAARQAE